MTDWLISSKDKVQVGDIYEERYVRLSSGVMVWTDDLGKAFSCTSEKDANDLINFLYRRSYNNPKMVAKDKSKARF